MSKYTLEIDDGLGCRDQYELEAATDEAAVAQIEEHGYDMASEWDDEELYRGKQESLPYQLSRYVDGKEVLVSFGRIYLHKRRSDGHVVIECVANNWEDGHRDEVEIESAAEKKTED